MPAPSFLTALRTARANVLEAALDAGTAAIIEIYGTPRPANANAAVGAATLLATLTCNAVAGAVANGVLTFAAITSGIAVADGTAVWARISNQLAGTVVMDVDVTVAAGAGPIKLDQLAILTGETVDIHSGVITEGNA